MKNVRYGILPLILALSACTTSASQVQPTALASPTMTLSPSVPPTATPPPITSPTCQESFSTLLESDVDCHVPCWNGLRPGASTRYDFELFLKTLDEESLADLQYDGSYSARWVDTHTGMLTDVVFEEDRIIYIAFHPVRRTVLTLEDIFECIGTPDSYSAEVISGRHGEIGFILSLVYPEIGLIVSHYDWEYEPDNSNFQPLCRVDVSPALRVSTIDFATTDTISAQMNSKALDVAISVNLRSVEPWTNPGFGIVRLTGCQKKR